MWKVNFVMVAHLQYAGLLQFAMRFCVLTYPRRRARLGLEGLYLLEIYWGYGIYWVLTLVVMVGSWCGSSKAEITLVHRLLGRQEPHEWLQWRRRAQLPQML